MFHRKREGVLHPIIDLRVLNKYLQTYRFRILTLRQLSAVSPEECFATMNQDYRSLFSCSDYCRQFLRFAFKGAVFNYLVLPFGLSLTPFKCDEVAVAHLRDRGGDCNSKLQRASNSAAFVSSVAHLGTGLFSKSTEKSADIKLAVVFSQSENMLPAERICQSAEWPCFTAASRKFWWDANCVF